MSPALSTCSPRTPAWWGLGAVSGVCVCKGLASVSPRSRWCLSPAAAADPGGSEGACLQGLRTPELGGRGPCFRPPRTWPFSPGARLLEHTGTQSVVSPPTHLSHGPQDAEGVWGLHRLPPWACFTHAHQLTPWEVKVSSPKPGGCVHGRCEQPDAGLEMPGGARRKARAHGPRVAAF